MLDSLIKLGFDPNKADDLGQTCLFYAARQGCLLLLPKLKQAGANFNHSDTNGQTPIFYAAGFSDKSDILPALVSHGANPHHVDNLAHQTPIFYATKSNWLQNVKYLI